MLLKDDVRVLLPELQNLMSLSNVYLELPYCRRCFKTRESLQYGNECPRETHTHAHTHTGHLLNPTKISFDPERRKPGGHNKAPGGNGLLFYKLHHLENFLGGNMESKWWEIVYVWPTVRFIQEVIDGNCGKKKKSIYLWYTEPQQDSGGIPFIKKTGKKCFLQLLWYLTKMF